MAGVLEVIHNYYDILLKPPNTCDQFSHMYKRTAVFQALCCYEISTVEKKTGLKQLSKGLLDILDTYIIMLWDFIKVQWNILFPDDIAQTEPRDSPQIEREIKKIALKYWCWLSGQSNTSGFRHLAMMGSYIQNICSHKHKYKWDEKIVSPLILEHFKIKEQWSASNLS